MKIKHHYYLLWNVDASKVRQCALDNANKGEISAVHPHEEGDMCQGTATGCEIYGV